MAATVSRTNATVDGTARRGATRRDLPPIVRADGLFAEDQFEWPEPPGDAKKEAKLPLFAFADRHEARTFLLLFTMNQLIGLACTANMFLGNRLSVFLVLLAIGTMVNPFYLWRWIRLCRRAHPTVGWVNWFTGGVFNIVSWQALSQASSVVRQR